MSNRTSSETSKETKELVLVATPSGPIYDIITTKGTLRVAQCRHADTLVPELRAQKIVYFDCVMLEHRQQLSNPGDPDLSFLSCRKLFYRPSTNVYSFDLGNPRLPSSIEEFKIVDDPVYILNSTDKVFYGLVHLNVQQHDFRTHSMKPEWCPDLKVYETNRQPVYVFPSLEMYVLSDSGFVALGFFGRSTIEWFRWTMSQTPHLRFILYDGSREQWSLDLATVMEIAEIVSQHHWISWMDLRLCHLRLYDRNRHLTGSERAKHREAAIFIRRRFRMNRRNNVVVLIDVLGSDLARFILGAFFPSDNILFPGEDDEHLATYVSSKTRDVLKNDVLGIGDNPALRQICNVPV